MSKHILPKIYCYRGDMPGRIVDIQIGRWLLSFIWKFDVVLAVNRKGDFVPVFPRPKADECDEVAR